MEHKKHLAIDKILFNKEYPEVHKWLDEKFNLYYDWEHWKERHHLEAIKEKYSDQPIKFISAQIHVICDWISHLRVFELPKDRKGTLELLSYYCLISEDHEELV